MFPSHFSVADFGVFAVAMVLGLIVVLLFMFDFVSIFFNGILQINKPCTCIRELNKKYVSFLFLSEGLI